MSDLLPASCTRRDLRNNISRRDRMGNEALPANSHYGRQIGEGYCSPLRRTPTPFKLLGAVKG